MSPLTESFHTGKHPYSMFLFQHLYGEIIDIVSCSPCIYLFKKKGGALTHCYHFSVKKMANSSLIYETTLSSSAYHFDLMIPKYNQHANRYSIIYLCWQVSTYSRSLWIKTHKSYKSIECTNSIYWLTDWLID